MKFIAKGQLGPKVIFSLGAAKRAAESKISKAIENRGGKFLRESQITGEPVLSVILAPLDSDKELSEIKKLTNLRYIDLVGTKVTDAGLAELVEVKKLQGLRLSGFNITDRGLKKLCELSHLNELVLRNTQITDEGVTELNQLHNLEKLEINGPNIHGAGLTAFKGHSNLKSLNLNGIRITDSGLSAIKDLTYLTELCLRKSSIDAWRLQHLLRSLLFAFQAPSASLERLRPCSVEDL